ncbi:MAG: hypothetical protein ACHQ7N_08410 [Candidatus Methylomirabilales bacterium]
MITGGPATGELSFRDAFIHRAYNALTELASAHRRIQFCSECRRPFVVKRIDSKICSASCRTAAWRKEHPEEFREQRKKYYRKKRAQQLGKDPGKVAIQTRKKREREAQAPRGGALDSDYLKPLLSLEDLTAEDRAKVVAMAKKQLEEGDVKRRTPR